MTDKDVIQQKVDAELSRINDTTLLSTMKPLLVVPRCEMREWDYGDKRSHAGLCSIMSQQILALPIAITDSVHRLRGACCSSLATTVAWEWILVGIQSWRMHFANQWRGMATIPLATKLHSQTPRSANNRLNVSGGSRRI
jgi:hypothetical protein